MPVRLGRTRCHPGPGRSGGSMSRSRSGPTSTPLPGASRDATAAAAYRSSERSKTRAFTPDSVTVLGPIGQVARRLPIVASLAEPVASPAPTVTTTRAWQILVLISFGQVFAIVDSSVLNVAFPAMQETFDGTPRSTLAWALTGYIIASGAGLLESHREAHQ